MSVPSLSTKPLILPILTFIKKKIILQVTGLRDITCQSQFGSVVAVAFQITFHAEMHVNDVFLFFKNYF